MRHCSPQRISVPSDLRALHVPPSVCESILPGTERFLVTDTNLSCMILQTRDARLKTEFLRKSSSCIIATFDKCAYVARILKFSSILSLRCPGRELNCFHAGHCRFLDFWAKGYEFFFFFAHFLLSQSHTKCQGSFSRVFQGCVVCPPRGDRMQISCSFPWRINCSRWICFWSLLRNNVWSVWVRNFLSASSISSHSRPRFTWNANASLFVSEPETGNQLFAHTTGHRSMWPTVRCPGSQRYVCSHCLIKTLIEKNDQGALDLLCTDQEAMRGYLH